MREKIDRKKKGGAQKKNKKLKRLEDGWSGKKRFGQAQSEGEVRRGASLLSRHGRRGNLGLQQKEKKKGRE